MITAPYSIRMATPVDDSVLRSLFRETPLPGAFEITLEREPSYFESQTDALQHEVFVGTQNDKIIACGSRVVREVWWEGRANRVAYLGELRCHPSIQRRAGWLIRDGYRALAEHHAQSPTATTWTAVFEENTVARQVLTGRSAAIPEYIDRGRLHCPILLVPRWAREPRKCGLSFQQGQPNNWEEIAGFLNSQLQLCPLAPVHTAAEFAEGMRWRCLEAADFILARRQDRLVGVVAVWDVRTFRQVRIAAVRGKFRRFRTPLNVLASLSGWPRLPEDGAILPIGYVSFLAAENENPDLAAALLLAARAAASRRGLGFLCACAHEHHPFAKILKRLPAISSHGRLYEVAFNGARSHWPTTAPHIEPALL